MSDYWKSLPRKFCDICKCWFADNKSSIEFHEKGKNHQENMKKRINQIQKKGLKDYKAKLKLDSQMEKIEKAALAAFRKDVDANPELADQYRMESAKIQNAPPKETPIFKEPAKRKGKNTQNKAAKKHCPPASQPQKPWYEAKSDDGQIYYWNTVTSESQWEPPEEGFVSIKEQSDLVTSQASTSQEEPVSRVEIPSHSFGPQPKSNPYGEWVPAEEKVAEPVDWQLPTKNQDVVEVTIPLHKDTSFKIKEKTVGQLTDEFSSGQSTFKKRKLIGRCVRQRDTDN